MPQRPCSHGNSENQRQEVARRTTARDRMRWDCMGVQLSAGNVHTWMTASRPGVQV